MSLLFARRPSLLSPALRFKTVGDWLNFAQSSEQIVPVPLVLDLIEVGDLVEQGDDRVFLLPRLGNQAQFAQLAHRLVEIFE